MKIKTEFKRRIIVYSGHESTGGQGAITVTYFYDELTHGFSWSFST